MTHLSPEEELKLINDPFYWSMVENGYNYSQLQASGWFNTQYTHQDNQEHLRVFSSSLESKLDHCPDEPFILLNTGSYAPVHEGHLEMMRVARDHLMEQGFSIDALIMSPSHDGYVLTKSPDIKSWTIEKRLEELKEKISLYPEDAYHIELWESLFCQHPVNFTDVIFHLVHSLKSLGFNKFKIGYVFGSDNQAFCDAFAFLPPDLKEKFHAICVTRDNHELKSQHFYQLPNIHYTKMIHHGDKQSRIIRKSHDTCYAIREDKEFALKKWIAKYPQHEEQLLKSFEDFHEGLCHLFSDTCQMPTISIHLNQQIKNVKKLSQNKAIINLDAATNHLPNQWAINFCRHFNIADLQDIPNGITQRPEASNHHVIPAGKYSFVDDDISSGKTLTMVRTQLASANINIEQNHNLAKDYCIDNGYHASFYDIVDTRDFLLGSFGGGLVCKFKKEFIRLPYWTPWVNLNSRAKIPYNQIKKFCLKIIELNLIFFSHNSFLELEDLNTEQKAFFSSQFSFSCLVELIEQHKKWVDKFIA